MASEERAESRVRQAIDQGRQAADKASQTVKEGYVAAQQYATEQDLDFGLGDFVRREPWLALAARLWSVMSPRKSFDECPESLLRRSAGATYNP